MAPLSGVISFREIVLDILLDGFSCYCFDTNQDKRIILHGHLKP